MYVCTIHIARISGVSLPVFSVGKFWQELGPINTGPRQEIGRHIWAGVLVMKKAGFVREGGSSIFDFVTETF